MNRAHGIELRWLLDGSYECALGVRSAHASLVALLEGGGDGGGSDAQTAAEERMIEAVRRGNRIREVLFRCSKKTQRVLAAYYSPEKLSTYWRELTHVLPLTTKYDRKKHGPIDAGLGMRMEVATATPEQREAVRCLRRAAEDLAEDAHAEYERLANERAAATQPRPAMAAE